MSLSQGGLAGEACGVVVAWQANWKRAGRVGAGRGAKYNSFLFTEDAVQRERVPAGAYFVTDFGYFGGEGREGGKGRG